MPSQKQIDFQVRKGMRSTRSSAKLALQSESPKATVKRTRSCRTPRAQENKPSVVKDLRENAEPDHKLKSTVTIPIARLEEPSKRIPLSPRKDLQNAIKTPTDRYVPRGAIGLLSNNTPAYENKPTPDQSARISPAKIRALTFGSPVKSNIPATPEKPSPGTSKARALAFSPHKRCAPQDENCPSPAKSPRKAFGNIFSSPGKSPRKRLLHDENSPSPRKSPRKSLSSSPRKPFGSPLRLFKQEGECYQQAKQALHTALPKKIVGREAEQKVVDTFMEKCLVGEKPGSLYISGAPGTGKTAILSHKLQEIKEECYYKTCYINCMSTKNSQAIYNKILGQIKGKETSLPMKQCVQQLEKCFTSSGPMILMVLDEIDSLDSKSQEVLYTMFEWPSHPKSRLVLIGIANALDLTDRILPRLQARPKCKPELLNFPPYTKDQIVAVLTDRLEKIEVAGHKVLEPSAIQFCARKVSAVAGDMRKALDVCRRAVEMVEADIRKQRLLGSPCKSPSKRVSVPKKITVAHILKIVNEVYGTRVAAQPGKHQAMPLQQKLAICTLLLMLKSGKGKEVLLGKYHECYSKICAKQNVSKIDQSEFLSMLSLIEARGVLTLKRGKDTRNTKVSLKLDERELEGALQDKILISNILSGGIPK